MPRKSPYTIVLAPAEQAQLTALARKYTSPYYLVLRTKIVLLAALGQWRAPVAFQHHRDRQREAVAGKW